MKFMRSIVLILSLCLVLLSARSQEKSFDILIPFNKNWEICDRSFASYYRTGTLVTGNTTYFTGEVKDHFKGAGLQMTGLYNASGLKDGIFKYYYPDGKIEREGAYKNDEMVGIWSFYAADGSLILKADCKSNYDFTPLYYKDKNGKETLKDGNGQFVFDMRMFPDLIWDSSVQRIGYIEGECINGLKSGNWKYYITANSVPDQGKYLPMTLVFEDRYKDGRFVSGKMTSVVPRMETYSSPRTKVTLYPKKDLKISSFATDFAFGHPPQNSNNLSDFLFNGKKPFRISTSPSYGHNMKDYIECFNAAFKLHTYHSTRPIFKLDFSGDTWSFFEELLPLGSREDAPANSHANLEFVVAKDGRIHGMKIQAENLPLGMEKTLSYYFSILRNLAPMPDTDSTKAQLKFSVLNEVAYKDGVKVNLSYGSLTNGNSQPADRFYVVKDSVVLVPMFPSFPGGNNAWYSYLQNSMRQRMQHAKIEYPKRMATIYATFVVGEDGKLTEVSYNKESTGHPEIAELLVKTLMHSPKWTPGSMQGKPIKYRMQLPFKIESDSKLESNAMF